MRPVKRVLLGSAAGVFAVAGAQAADLPVKAKPVEYVKVCSLYGAGFWYVPGTDTCIKVGAFVKMQVIYNANPGGPWILGGAANGAGDTGGRNTRTDTSPFTFNNRAACSMDLRTQTQYGTMRSYADWFVQTQASDVATTQLSAVTIGQTRAFIQFAGFTAGRMRSFFDLWTGAAYAVAGRFNADTGPNGIIGAAYTWQFGGGLSASVSLEDNGEGASGRGRSTVNLAFGGPNVVVASGTTPIVATPSPLAVGGNTFDNKGQQFFDPVANLRLDQTWGFVGVSAALHDASGGYYGASEGTGHPGDKFGWAVQAGGLFTNPFGLQGDTIAIEGVYSKGAAGYATSAWGPTAVYGSGLNVGLGWLMEGVYTTGTNVELTTVWSAQGVYEHRWNPQWRTSVYGGMFGVEYDGAAKTAICANLAAT